MIEERKTKIKKMIEDTINSGRLEDAKSAIENYIKVVPDDIDIYSMLGVIYILENKLDDAKEILLEGLIKDDSNFDINYNLGYIADLENNEANAYYFYNKSYEACADNNLKNEIYNKIKELLEKNKELLDYKRLKLAIFCIKGLDNFLHDIIVHLSYNYEVKLILVSNNEELKLVDQWMEWADICWFEWCNELAVYGSRLPIANQRKVICRLHSYEAFTYNIKNVVWENIDKIIFVSDNLKKIVTEKVNIEENKIEVIPNGISMKKWTFNEKKRGFNIAYVGYINYKKGPMLLLHTFKAIYDKDNRYKLYIAGEFQDERYILYFNQMTKQLGLENNIFFEGWQDDLDKWLGDKDYILCTSLLESQNISVMQAMAKGIKPIVHNFFGAKEIYDKKYLWDTINEAIDMILSYDYNSNEYRKFIEDRYSLIKQITHIKSVLNRLSFNKEKQVFFKLEHILGEKVNFENIDDLTIIIPTYNRANLLKEDLIYGHKLGNQKKIIVDDCSNIENKNILNQLLSDRKNYGIENIIFNNVNKGVASAINLGIQNVKTKYLSLCGDDDKLFCLNKYQLVDSLKELNNDYLFIIPRYVLNIDSYNNVTIGYDRKKFDDKLALNTLETFFKTGEIEVLAAGLIVSTDLTTKCIPESIFRVSEDYVFLSRLLANNMHKKLKVLDSFVYLRRINDNTLSKAIDIEKLSLHLISLIISGFYCLKYNIISKDEFFDYINKRANIIQQIYGFGIDYINLLFDYLTKKISLNDFIEVNKNRFIKQLNLENIPKELFEIINLL